MRFGTLSTAPPPSSLALGAAAGALVLDRDVGAVVVGVGVFGGGVGGGVDINRLQERDGWRRSSVLGGHVMLEERQTRDRVLRGPSIYDDASALWVGARSGELANEVHTQ